VSAENIKHYEVITLRSGAVALALAANELGGHTVNSIEDNGYPYVKLDVSTPHEVRLKNQPVFSLARKIDKSLPQKQ